MWSCRCGGVCVHVHVCVGVCIGVGMGVFVGVWYVGVVGMSCVWSREKIINH